MAERLGVRQSTVSRLEAGIIPTDRRTILAAQSLLPKPSRKARAA